MLQKETIVDCNFPNARIGDTVTYDSQVFTCVDCGSSIRPPTVREGIFKGHSDDGTGVFRDKVELSQNNPLECPGCGRYRYVLFFYHRGAFAIDRAQMRTSTAISK